ncbi:MAG: restriction endonuclease [Spirochaetes bacterium]|nr:MAG: restriction endonuclease [Spirochaetota bacterium]
MPLIIVLVLIIGIAIAVITIFIMKSVLAPKKLATVANYQKQGKHLAAIRLVKQILLKEPRNAEAHYLLANSYLAENKAEIALMELKAVNQIGSFGGYCKENEFRLIIAELYEQFNQPEEALKEYVLLIKLMPTMGEYYYRAGKLFENRNKAEKAVQYYRKAIQLTPRLSKAHYSLGFILFRGKKNVEAKAEFEAALKYKADFYAAHFYLGKLQKGNHDYIPALLSFEKASRDQDFKVKSLVERGACYMSLKSFDKAIIELERGIKLTSNAASPETLYARYFLASCHEQERDFENAIDQWEQIYAKKPNFRDVAEKLSQYQELRSDDKMKDFLTSGVGEFQEICKALTTTMGLNITELSDIKNGCEIIAVDGDTKWRGTRKMPKLIWYLRIPEMVPDTTVRAIHEKMKALNVSRSIIVVSTNFSRKAQEYAESRPIDLIGKEKLQTELKKVDFKIIHAAMKKK